MLTLQVKWIYGGAVLIALISGLVLSTSVMKPWNPMPLYQVVLAWVIAHYYLAVMPSLYLITTGLASSKANFSKIVIIAIVVLATLNFVYFWNSWGYGYKYQGELHTNIVALVNLFGFSIALFLAIKAHIKNNIPTTYLANFILFALLSWCAFPYLGELPWYRLITIRLNTFRPKRRPPLDCLRQPFS